MNPNERCSHFYGLLWAEQGDFVCCRYCEQSWEFRNGWKPINGPALEALTRGLKRQFVVSRKRKFDGGGRGR